MPTDTPTQQPSLMEQDRAAWLPTHPTFLNTCDCGLCRMGSDGFAAGWTAAVERMAACVARMTTGEGMK